MACNIIRHRCFPENFVKFLRTPFFTERTPPVATSEQSTVAVFVREICSSNNVVPCPDVFCYHLNGMNAPKNAPQKIIVTLFLYIFHVKPKWNIVYETKIFSRDSNIYSQMHWTSNIFGHSATIIGSIGLSLKYLILNFKKKSDMPTNKHPDAARTVMQHNRQPIQNDMQESFDMVFIIFAAKILKNICR